MKNIIIDRELTCLIDNARQSNEDDISVLKRLLIGESGVASVRILDFLKRHGHIASYSTEKGNVGVQLPTTTFTNIDEVGIYDFIGNLNLKEIETLGEKFNVISSYIDEVVNFLGVGTIYVEVGHEIYLLLDASGSGFGYMIGYLLESKNWKVSRSDKLPSNEILIRVNDSKGKVTINGFY